MLAELSGSLAEALGKPERYVMVTFRHTPDMLFGGSDKPLAYLELKSLGLPEDRTSEISAFLCGFMETHFQVPASRVYIEMVSPPRHMFGWKGGTF